MSDIEKIVYGVLGGILVYVANFFIKPLSELRKTIKEIHFNLLFHGPTIHTPIGRSKETSDAARDALLKNSSELFAKLHVIPFYSIVRFVYFGTLPPSKNIEDAAVQLRGLSTYMHQEGEEAYVSLDVIRKRVVKIEQLLRFRPLDT